MCGEAANLCIECKASKTIDNANIGVIINALSGQNERILYITSASDEQILKIEPGKVDIQLQMLYCCLLPGLYSAKIYIKDGVSSLDIVQSFRFVVKTNQFISQSLFYQPHTWQITNN